MTYITYMCVLVCMYWTFKFVVSVFDTLYNNIIYHVDRHTCTMLKLYTTVVFILYAARAPTV